jgi:hypothetical protein
LKRRAAASVMLLLCTVPVVTPSVAGRLFYRYTDAQGVVVIDDTVPPELAPRGYEVVNEWGTPIRVVAPAKTAEQIAEEARLAKQRKLDQQRAAEQARQDAVLLRSYSDMSAMIKARDEKIATLESLILITQSKLAKLRQDLHALQQRAADAERRGEKVPASLESDIRELAEALQTNETYISDKRREQEDIRRRFAVDIERYRRLVADRDGAAAHDN